MAEMQTGTTMFVSMQEKWFLGVKENVSFADIPAT
jgi:hypothetical protein